MARLPRAKGAILFFWKTSFYIRNAADIVHIHAVKLSKFDRAFQRDPCFSEFIIRICFLPDVQQIGNMLLRKITIFPKLTNPNRIVHTLTSGKV